MLKGLYIVIWSLDKSGKRVLRLFSSIFICAWVVLMREGRILIIADIKRYLFVGFRFECD